MKRAETPGGKDKRWFDQHDQGVTGVEVADDTARVWAGIEELGLYEYAAELDVKGYTVVPPQKTQVADGWAREARETIHEIAQRRFGPEVLSGDRVKTMAAGLSMSHFLEEAPIVDEAVLNPVANALAHLVVGNKAVMSTSAALLKGPCDEEVALHCDALNLPSPFPSICPGINMTWALTRYTKDDGCLCIVPGSHKLYRHPLSGEGVSQRVPVEAEEGSLIVWGAYTWHGAFARKNPGLRVTLINSFQRPHMRSKERWDDFPVERVEANPDLAKLVRSPMGWGKEGPQYNVFGDDVQNAYE